MFINILTRYSSLADLAKAVRAQQVKGWVMLVVVIIAVTAAWVAGDKLEGANDFYRMPALLTFVAATAAILAALIIVAFTHPLRSSMVEKSILLQRISIVNDPFHTKYRGILPHGGWEMISHSDYQTLLNSALGSEISSLEGYGTAGVFCEAAGWTVTFSVKFQAHENNVESWVQNLQDYLAKQERSLVTFDKSTTVLCREGIGQTDLGDTISRAARGILSPVKGMLEDSLEIQGNLFESKPPFDLEPFRQQLIRCLEELRALGIVGWYDGDLVLSHKRSGSGCVFRVVAAYSQPTPTEEPAADDARASETS